jgi:transcriptional regulator with XRE-family HTH domain
MSYLRKHRDADIVRTGLPIVNIGKLIGMTPRDRTPFGQRMVEARKRAGLTQQQVAEALKIRQGTLAELEVKGQGSAMVVQYASLYGCSPAWLATGEGAPPASHATGSTSIGAAVLALARGLRRSDDMTREMAAPLLARLARQPAEGPEIARRLERLIAVAEAPPILGKNEPVTHLAGSNGDSAFGGLGGPEVDVEPKPGSGKK